MDHAKRMVNIYFNSEHSKTHVQPFVGFRSLALCLRLFVGLLAVCQTVKLLVRLLFCAVSWEPLLFVNKLSTLSAPYSSAVTAYRHHCRLFHVLSQIRLIKIIPVTLSYLELWVNLFQEQKKYVKKKSCSSIKSNYFCQMQNSPTALLWNLWPWDALNLPAVQILFTKQSKN